ncbi:MAG TPA: adenosine deaminase [Gemmatirosa sp.]
MTSLPSDTHGFTPLAADDLDRRLREMPKVELHVHLEGAMDADAVWAMAARNGTPLPAATLDAWRAFYAFRDFDHFIEVYTAAARAMSTPEDWAFMVEHFCARQAAQGVVYTEAFLSASLMLQSLPPRVLLDAIAAGLAVGEARHGVQVRFIPDIARHVPETRWGVLDFVSMGHETRLFLGLGLGGPEVGFPPELFRDVYEEARTRGLHVVAHAGETVGATSVRGAIDALGAERIGHGVRCLEDPEVVALARSRGIPFEVCPTSNYRLKVVRDGEPHPLRRMVDAGLVCTVNSDDPPMFGTTLVDEYRLLARQGFGWDELWTLNQNALAAAFLGDAEREEYGARYAGWLATAGLAAD